MDGDSLARPGSLMTTTREHFQHLNVYVCTEFLCAQSGENTETAVDTAAMRAGVHRGWQQQGVSSELVCVVKYSVFFLVLSTKPLSVIAHLSQIHIYTVNKCQNVSLTSVSPTVKHVSCFPLCLCASVYFTVSL